MTATALRASPTATRLRHLSSRNARVHALADARRLLATVRQPTASRWPTSRSPTARSPASPRIGKQPSRRTPSISPAASSCRASSTATPISTRAISGRASPIPTAPSWARSNAIGRRPRRALERRGRRAPHGFLAALRLRARHQGAAHPSRQRRRRRRRSPGRCSRRCASAGAAASSCRLRACSASRRVRDRSLVRRRWPTASRRRRACSACVTYMVPDLEALLDRVFAHAIEHGLDLDFHADETDDIGRDLADARSPRPRCGTAFEGKILVGHCCSLARQPDRRRARTLDKVARGRASPSSRCRCAISICRIAATTARTPRWRGVTLLHEMKARGIPVAVASDNTRDPFYAYGDLDMLEVYREATRILHLDHPVGDWPQAVAATPAEIMRLDGSGMLARRRGRPISSCSAAAAGRELLSRPESDRIVRARRQGDRPRPARLCRTRRSDGVT